MFDIRILPLDPNTVFTPPVTDEKRLADAIVLWDTEVVKTFITQDPALLDCNLGEQYGYHTPLSYAVSCGNYPQVETLLDLGASPFYSTPLLGLPPLAAASQANIFLTPDITLRILNLILDHAKKLGNEAVKKVTEWRSPDGDTLLTLLCERGHIMAIKQILAIAPELATYSRNDGNYPLHLAIINRHPSVAEMLLELAPGIGNKPNDQEDYPLLLSIIHNSPCSLIETLLNYGADINSTNPAGNSALILACQQKDMAKAKVIFRHNPDTTIVNIHNMAAISYAALSGNPELLQLFRGQNKPNYEDMIPPHFHLVISPSSDTTFKEMLDEINSQGFSIRQEEDNSAVALYSEDKSQIQKLKTIASIVGDGVLEETKPRRGAIENIIYLINPSGKRKKKPNSRNFTIFVHGVFVEDEIYNLTDLKTNFILNYSSLFHDSGNNGSSKFDMTPGSNGFNICLIKMALEEKITPDKITNLIKTDLFIYFLRSLKNSLFKYGHLLSKDKKYTVNFMTTLYKWNKINKIEFINDLIIKYFYESALINLTDKDKVDFLINFEIFSECINPSLKNIIMIKLLISNFNKINPEYSNNDLLKLSSINNNLIEKLATLKNSNQDDGSTHIILILAQSIFLYERNERFNKYLKDGLNEKAIDEAYIVLNQAKALIKRIPFLEGIYADHKKLKKEINEIIFEFYYQICVLLKDNSEKKEEVINFAKEAILIPIQKINLLQSEQDKNQKRNFLKKLIKALTKTSKKSLENESESENENKNPEIPSNEEIKTETPSEAKSDNINTKITEQTNIQVREEYIRIAESEQLLTLNTRKRYKPTKQPSNKHIANIAPIPVKQPKWSETEVRNAYPELNMKPNPIPNNNSNNDKDKPLEFLIPLNIPGKPYGSYWGYFALTPASYANPEEYNNDLQKFNDDSSLLRSKGVYYMHNAGKGNRPHGTCYITKGGPALVAIDQIFDHETHMKKLNDSYAPKAYLVRPTAPAAALVGRAPA